MSVRLKKGVYEKLLIEQDYKCFYCGAPETTKNRFEIDHIVPKKHGGKNSESNYVIACRLCNIQKSDKSVSVWLKEVQNKGDEHFHKSQRFHKIAKNIKTKLKVKIIC